MTAYVALLRAINVGGTGKLPMADLVGIGHACGFARPRTYIASGNLLFDSDLDEQSVKRVLEERLAARMGKPIGVVMRTAAELAAVLAANPFPDAPGNRVLVTFLDGPPPPDAIAGARHLAGERIAAGPRELYVLYAAGMASSRLVIPAARAGTTRNMNTVARLAVLANAR